MEFHFEAIPIIFPGRIPVERDSGTDKFVIGLINRREAGLIRIPMQGLNVFNEMAKNTADHTLCHEALFAYAQFNGVGRFIYLDDGGGPRKTLEWCLAEGNSTGNPEHNCGLGLPTIFDILSRPIDMVVRFVQSGNVFGYSGEWPLRN